MKTNLKNSITGKVKMKKVLLLLIVPLMMSTVGCGQLTKLMNVAETGIQDTINANTTKIYGTVSLAHSTVSDGVTVKLYKQKNTINSSSIKTSSFKIAEAADLVTETSTNQSGNYTFNFNVKKISTSSIKTQEIELDTGYYTAVYSKDGYASKSVYNIPVTIGSSDYQVDSVTLNSTDSIAPSAPTELKQIGSSRYSYPSSPGITFQKVKLTWTNSSESDTVGYCIEKKDFDNSWTSLSVLEGDYATQNPCEFLLIDVGTIRIRALDSNGNKSDPSNEIFIDKMYPENNIKNVSAVLSGLNLILSVEYIDESLTYLASTVVIDRSSTDTHWTTGLSYIEKQITVTGAKFRKGDQLSIKITTRDSNNTFAKQSFQCNITL